MTCCNSGYSHNILGEYRQGATMPELSDKYGINSGNISRFIRQHGIETRKMRRGKPLPESAYAPTHELGYILGVLSGDGNLQKTASGNYNIRLQTVAPEFAGRFKTCLERWLGKPVWIRVYLYASGFNPTPRNRYIIIGSSKQAYQFLKSTGASGTRTWRVPALVKNGGRSIKAGYLRGLFDSEGSLAPDRIRIYSSNLNGLEDAQKILLESGIECKIAPIRNQWYLVIYGTKNMNTFCSLVGWIE